MSPRKEPHNGTDRKDPENIQSKYPQNSQEEYQADILTDIGLPRMLLSSKQHSIPTPEDLSKIWGLSLAQATLTLKITTQTLVRSAVMPLARRYQTYHMFDVRRVHGMMSTYTMNA